MNRIQTALYNRQIKKLTRKYQAQAAFNATEQSRADWPPSKTPSPPSNPAPIAASFPAESPLSPNPVPLSAGAVSSKPSAPFTTSKSP